MSVRKLSSILLAALIIFGATLTFSTDYKTKLTLTVAAASPTYDETYTFTQPADFTITKSGWNSLGNITAKYSGSNSGFDTSKKLVVTVTSTNSFALKSGENSITYKHATSASDTTATTTFEFTAAEITTEGTSKAVGVIVADYSSAAAGTYTDEITYTVAIEDAGTTLLSLTVQDNDTGIGNKTFYYAEGETWAQALANHPTENPAGNDDPNSGQDGFAVENGEVKYVTTGGGRYTVENAGSSSTVKGDDVISSSSSYQFTTA